MASDLAELNRVGNCALNKYNFQDAEQAFRQLIADHPTETEGYVGISKVFSRSDRHEELIALIEPVADGLESEQLLRLLADACRVLANRGVASMVDRSLKYYSKLHQRRSDPVSLFYEADLYSKKKKDHEAALRIYRQAWELAPRDQKIYSAILGCLRKLGRVEEVDETKEQWRLLKRK